MEPLQPLYDKNVACLYCKRAFTTKKLRSRFAKVVRYDTDFCPVYKEGTVNALHYYISVCPHCGFSFSEDFSRYFPPSTMESIEDKICSRWQPHHFSDTRNKEEAIDTYKLASYCGLLKKEKHIILAGLYLRIAWLYRSTSKPTQEKRFLKMALSEYEASYSTGDFSGSQVSEARVLYLAGDIAKRLGERKAAIKFFSMVLEKQKDIRETSLVQMARDRWQEIKEEKDRPDLAMNA